MPASSIGQRFTQLIQHLGLSKNAFAQSLDKTATVIQHLVDERNKPGYDLLCRVFETYPNVSTNWLLLGQGSMMNDEGPTPSAPVPAPEPARVSAALPLAAATVAKPADEVLLHPTPPAGAPAAVVPPAAEAATPVVAPAGLPAQPAGAAPDANYLTVVLQTQHLQHQLRLAEQRNQHLLEQQQLMQQMVALLQTRSL